MLEVDREIVEGELNAIDPGFLELQESVDDLLRAADKVEIAANGPMQASLVAPGLGIATATMLGEILDRHFVGGGFDGIAISHGLTFGVAAKHHRIDYCPDLATHLRSPRVDRSHMRWQAGHGILELVAGRTGDE